jgi:hypothetical protein
VNKGLYGTVINKNFGQDIIDNIDNENKQPRECENVTINNDNM